MTRLLLVLATGALLSLLAACQDSSLPRAPVQDAAGGALSTVQTTSATPGKQPTASSTRPVSPTPEPYGLPLPTSTPRAYDYPGAPGTGSPSPRASATVTAGQDGDELSYLPFAIGGLTPTATATSEVSTPAVQSTPTAVRPTPTPEPVATLDVSARRAELEGTDSELAFSKIGFHVTFLEEKGVLDRWMEELDAAGIPFFLKTVDNAEPLFKAQKLAQESGVPHTLVFRATGGVPDYSLPPEEAAKEHWELHRDLFPPELDPSLVWVETINEVDKNRSAWLAEFALETARLAMADGFRWAAFGWASGEPEPEDWELPAMLEFLRLAGENPDRVAIALHEYSLDAEDGLRELYPYRLGRFMQLFEVADRHDIPRPTVLITEFGWEYNNIPPVDQAMDELTWAADLYASFPQVKGAALWNLGAGCCFGTVSEEVHQLIDPVRRFNLTTAYSIPRAPEQASTDHELYR